MRIAPTSVRSISGVPNYQRRLQNKARTTAEIPQPQNDNINFKGGGWQVAGAILGTVAVIVAAPAVAVVGLAGIGTLGGAIAGGMIEEKLEEKKKQKP